MTSSTDTGSAGPGRTPLDVPLDGGGTMFIEASAGTGKTHALTTLVARLVVEEDWPLDRILVVTFTRAATAELRDRIRRVLAAVLAAARTYGHPEYRAAPASVPGAVQAAARTYGSPGPPEAPTPESGPPELEAGDAAPAVHRTQLVDSAGSARPPGHREQEADPQALELLAAWEGRGGSVDAALARRLEAAMRDIDRANVHTIHGFCQRVLADLAFESGFPFGFEVSDGGEMVARAVCDGWRRRLYPASMLLMRHAVASGFLPGELASWVSDRRAKTRVTILGGDPLPEPIEVREAAWRTAFEGARAEWEQHRDGFRADVLEGGWLNRGRYRRARTEREVAALDALFGASEPWLPEEGALGRYGRGQLSQVCKRGFALPDNPVFDALDRLEQASGEFRSACDRWLRWTRREILTEVRASVRRHVRDDRRLAYDDLLIELEEALDGAGGSRLAARIRHEYPCALIDEYQDTDPVQARIFSRIYGENPDASGGEEAAERSAALTMAGSASAAREGSTTTYGANSGSSSASDARAGSATTYDASPGSSSAPGAGEGSATTYGASSGSSSTPGTREGSGPIDASGHARPGPFIVVGDPKQSIYRFRGADVFAYLAVRRTAHERLHLGRNWRSSPALVEAVNTIFAGAAPFVTREIEYRPVAAARDGGSPLWTASGEDAAPFRFWLLPRRKPDRLLAKQDAIPLVAGATADEIARLLELGARGEATIEGRPLIGADFAVLVRTKEQGRLVADALRERGVPGIQIDDGSVFDTREAEQIERLLWAMTAPGRETIVRGALAGDVFGLDVRALAALGDDEDVWSGWAARLADWRSHWHAKGVGSILLRVLEAEGGATHLLGHRDGARRLTNYRHLAELLQETETRERFAPAELAAWLNRRRTRPGGRDDAVQLRLESDEQLVRILTVHGSKGLEFPVVFCPFAWDARSPRRRAGSVDAMYHLGSAESFREVLDLDPDERAASIEWLEEFSESVRLLYVALTRAKYRCVVAWGQVRGAEHSPLAWLLHRAAGGPATTGESVQGSGNGTDSDDRDAGAGWHEGVTAGGPATTGEPARASGNGTDADDWDAATGWLAGVAHRFVELSDTEWLGEIEALRKRLPDAVSVAVLDPQPRRARVLTGCDDAPPALAAREFGRELRRIRTLTSFSALSVESRPGAGHAPTAGGPPGDREAADLDRPDHDQREEPADPTGDETNAAGGRADREPSVFTFPRGPVAGSCLHRMFERLDMPAEPDAETFEIEDICRDALEEFGIDGAWRSVARDMVERTRAVALGTPNGFRLGDPLPRLVELDFHFPVDGLSRDRISSVLVEHGYPDPFARPGPDGAGGHPAPIHGFLRGFIDLVVEHDGRWYVVDYKSNWLGPEPDDYAPPALAEAMRTGGYTLQSLIYLVALHRYLTVRLPGYEYERHVGGAFYLFLRGIDAGAGMRRGVHFDRPSAACLHALDDCFRGHGA